MSTATLSITETTIREIDASRMHDLIRAFPEHWRSGWSLGAQFRSDILLQKISNVVVAGMGGSAIGGDLLRTYALDHSTVPISVLRGYELPAYVGAESLVIASSYSGNTEETIACLQEAISRNAHIICVATGGRVLEIARQHNLPHVTIPGGMPPRAALAYSFSVLLGVANKIGFARTTQADFEETDALLTKRVNELGNLAGNEALDIAHRIHGFLPVVYSGSGLLEAVNLRWRGQFQENAKTHSYGNLLPELNHNEIMGWEGTTWLLPKLAVITLTDRDDHPKVRRRFDVTKQLIEDLAGAWVEVETSGTSRLARMMSLIQLGDWVSFYLAMLNGADPTPIRLIDEFKRMLSD